MEREEAEVKEEAMAEPGGALKYYYAHIELLRAQITS
jgi:hypothetical protein